MKTKTPHVSALGVSYDDLIVSLAVYHTPTDTSVALTAQPCRVLPGGAVEVAEEDVTLEGEDGPVTRRVAAGSRTVSVGSANRNKDAAIKTATDALLRAVERLIDARGL